MTDAVRARVKDILTIGTLSIAVATALGAASLKLLGVQTKEAAAQEHQQLRVEMLNEIDGLREIIPLVEDARQWSWCSLNDLTPEQCRAVVPPRNWRVQ